MNAGEEGAEGWPFGADRAIDALGLRCPLPVLKLEAAMRASPGALIAIRADDPLATLDLPHAASSAGWSARSRPAPDGVCVFTVTRDDATSFDERQDAETGTTIA